MNPNEVVSIIERLGELLSPTAAKAWEIAMRQVHVQAVTVGALMVLCVVGIGIGLRCLGASVLGGKSTKEVEDEHCFGAFIVCVCGGVLILLGLNLYGILANPEYRAIELLLNLMGQ